jgi:NIMA-interacting peptidyl-prolyl cis-trans isomerase 1
LQGYEAELKPLTGSDLQDKFASLASANSDCGSHSHGGDLGLFGRGQMQKAFEEASYALAVDEMSGIVETDSGVHLILRWDPCLRPGW